MRPIQPDFQPELITLEALYDAYHRQVLGLAYRLLGSAEDAEEVAQEAFVAAWLSSSSYDAAKGSTRTWLLTLVRRRCIDILRRRGRRPSITLAPEVQPADEHDVSKEALTRIESARAQAALVSLPPEQREVIMLAYWSGLSHSEIASQLQLPLGTVKGRIRLALDRLRDEFSEPSDVRDSA